jgi:hypothetical protein
MLEPGSEEGEGYIAGNSADQLLNYLFAALVRCILRTIVLLTWGESQAEMLGVFVTSAVGEYAKLLLEMKTRRILEIQRVW